MRMSLASRIAALTFIYCVVFCVLVIAQFSNKGNFSLSAGAMTIRGRYLQESSVPAAGASAPTTAIADFAEDEGARIAGGIRIFYGGLEFTLKEERGKGLSLSGNEGAIPVNPEYMILTDNSARFTLPEGTVITFNAFDSARGQELHINMEAAENTTEVIIPISPRRSSVVRDNEQLGVMYGGLRYLFSTQGQELQTGKLILSTQNPFITYRSRGRQRAIEPADYIIAQSQNYESVLLNWKELSYARWTQTAGGLQNEDNIIAFCTEALARGSYPAAISAIPRNFVNSPRHSYRSAGFLGGMSNAYRSLTAAENEKINRITRLTRERSLDILLEENVLDYLFTRSYTALANEVISIIQNMGTQALVSDYCSGLLEAYSDLRRWRIGAGNPIEHLTEQILALILENLNRDAEKDHVFASSGENAQIDFEYSLRLGKALVYWAETNQNAEWTGVGKSLVLSALESGGAGEGYLYNILKTENNYPKAIWMADNGLWTWTVSNSVTARTIDGNISVNVSFPANMTHHVMIRGVRPFVKLQIHGMDWRTDSQFEIYDSSGWVYYPQEQTLIVKLRHREAVENITIFYRVAEPPPVIETETETASVGTSVGTVDAAAVGEM